MSLDIGSAEHVALWDATELARNIWEREWKQTAPNWEPLPDLLGVLTQIDNMTRAAWGKR